MAGTLATNVVPHELQTKVHDGIEVIIDLTYARSWDGIETAARMQSKRATEMERYLATVDYYRNSCVNIDEVVSALEAARPDEEVTANDVMAFVGEAIREGVEKN